MKKLTKENVIKEANIRHGNKYDYSLIDYINNRTKIKIICTIDNHGVFEQTPDNHLSGKGCPKCSGNIRLTTKEFIKQSKVINKYKFNYSLVEYKSTHTKVKIICSINEHGVFEQTPHAHLSGQGCPKCACKYSPTTNEFNKQSTLLHNNKYDYSLVNYDKNYLKVKIICPIKGHGVFEQTPHNHLSGQGCPKCNESKGEKEIRQFLLENNVDFIPQKKFKDCKDVRLLSFDFYLPEYNTCIEYDGEQHFKTVNFFGGKQGLLNIKRKDAIKTKYCYTNKIVLIRLNSNNINELDEIIKLKNEV